MRVLFLIGSETYLLTSLPHSTSTGPEYGDPARENEPLFAKISRSFNQEQNVDKNLQTALFDRGNPKRYLNKDTKVDTLGDCETDQEVSLRTTDLRRSSEQTLTIISGPSGCRQAGGERSRPQVLVRSTDRVSRDAGM